MYRAQARVVQHALPTGPTAPRHLWLRMAAIGSVDLPLDCCRCCCCCCCCLFVVVVVVVAVVVVVVVVVCV